MKFIKKYNESCDSLDYDDLDIVTEYYDKYVYPFIYRFENNNIYLYFGEEGDSHGKMYGRMTNKEFEEVEKSELGRLWENVSVITFWAPYPTKKEFKLLVDKIEEERDIRMWNNGWQIEVVDYEEFYYAKKLIPIEEYAGLSDIEDSEEKNIHLMDVKNKDKLKKSKYFGSKADKKPLYWKQALLKSENKDIVGTPIGKINDLWELGDCKLYDPYSDCYILLKNNKFKLIDADNNNLIYEYDIPFPGDESTNNEGNKLYLDSEMEYIDFLEPDGSSQYEMSIPDLELLPNKINETYIKKFKNWKKLNKSKLKKFENFKINSILVYITDEEIEWQLLDEFENRNINVKHYYEGNNFDKGILTVDVDKSNIKKVINILDFLNIKYNYKI